MPTPVLFYVGGQAHPFYREQFKAGPDDFPYVPSHPDLPDEGGVKRDITSRKRRSFAHRERARGVAMKLLGRAGHVRRRTLEVPPGVELIHSAQHLLRGSPHPYVVDFEDLHVFTMYQRDALTRPWARRALVRHLRDPQVGALLPWTEAAREGMAASLGPDFGERLAAKTTVVLPAVCPRASRAPQPRSGPLRTLFIGSTFLGKGGVEAILAVRRARETVDVELDMVTFPPPGWTDLLAGSGPIRAHSGISSAALGSLFESADVLVFPSHTDTLGFAVLEAMARAIPAVVTDHFALPELVEHERSGLVVEGENSAYGPDRRPIFGWLSPTRYPRSFRRRLASPSAAYVDRLAAALARLAGDRALLAGLADGALGRVSSGPLSVARRKERLAEVYARACR